jgi:hypothetical protein
VSKHDFAVTYRGVAVPAWVSEVSPGTVFSDESIREAFRTGVDVAIAFSFEGVDDDDVLPTAPEAGVNEATGQPVEPNRTKRWTDSDGDVWYWIPDHGWGYDPINGRNDDDYDHGVYTYGGWANVVSAFSPEWLARWRAKV